MIPMTTEQRKAAAAKGIETRRRNIAQREKERAERLLQRDRLVMEIRNLERTLAELKAHEIVSSMAFALTSQYLVREDEIVRKTLPKQKFSGVYFLVRQGRVVYVGQSVNVFARMQAHASKDFDSFAYIPCSVDCLDRLESLYIHVLCPPMNAADPRGGKVAPLRVDEMLRMASKLGRQVRGETPEG